MHTLKRLFCLLAISSSLVLGLALPAVLRAQVQDDPVTVPVAVGGLFQADGDAESQVHAAMAVYVGPSQIVNTETVLNTWVPTTRVVTQMRPGKDYVFCVGVGNAYGWKLHLDPPAGMTMYINNVERRVFTLDGDGGYASGATLKVRVEDGAAGGPGEASGLRPGRVVWSVGLGSLRNGRPAGVISIRENSSDNQLITRDSLIYDSASTEVDRVFDTNGTTLRQVFAPQCLVDIDDYNNHVVRLRFYSRNEIETDKVNGFWVVRNYPGTQDPMPPFVEYLIDNAAYPDATALKIWKTAYFGGTRTWWTQISYPTTADWRLVDWTEYDSQTAEIPTVAHFLYGDYDRDETTQVKNGPETILAAQTKKRFDDFAWGRELTNEQVGYGGSNPLVTTYTYHTDSNQPGNYTKTKWQVGPTGNWERYDYYTDWDRRGQIYRVYRPFLDSPSSPASASATSGVVTTYTYGQVDWMGGYSRPTLIETKTNNVTTAKTEISYDESTAVSRLSRYDNQPPPNDPKTISMVVATRKDYSDANNFLTTVTTVYREDADTEHRLPGLVHSVRRPDGTMEAHLYFKGTFDIWTRNFYRSPSGGAWAEYVIQGTTAPQSGDNAVLMTSYGESDQSNFIASDFHVVPGQSTIAVNVHDFDGTAAMTESLAYTTSGWVTVERTITAFDSTYTPYPFMVTRDSGNAANAADSANIMVLQETGWAYGRPAWTKDAAGSKRWFDYDKGGRVISERLESVSGQPQSGDQWTLHAFDAADREIRTARATSATGDASNDIASETDYDLAGRPTQQRASAPGTNAWFTTSYAYYVGGNPRLTQVTHPGGATTINQVYLDGRPFSVTGSAQPPKYFAYEVHPDGITRVSQGLTSSVSGDGWRAADSDWLGRVLSQFTPTGYGLWNNACAVFDSAGHVVERTLRNGPDGALLTAPTRYHYNSMGAVDREGMDVNENGSLDDTGADRVTTHLYTFTQIDSAWWREVTNKTLTNPGNATDGITTKTHTRLTGRTAATPSETRFIDANNQQTISTVSLNRSAATVTAITDLPTADSSHHAQRITVNGFLKQTISPEGVSSTFTYDAYGRLSRAQGRESVLEDKVYHPKTTLVQNVRNAIMTPGVIGSEWQEFTYDSAGRLAKQRTNNLGAWKTARYDYNAMGQLVHQWGDATNPAEFVYNSYGWKTTMSLFRGSFNNASETWPGGYDGVDTTTWNYQGSTGLVTSKVAPGGATVSFTYNRRNQVATRTWARNVVTTYGYFEDPGYRTGELRTVSYSDGTPTVEYFNSNFAGLVTRTGQPGRISGGVFRELFYRFNDGQLQAERLDWGFYGMSTYGGREVYRDYDTYGRPQGVHLGFEDSAHIGNTPNSLEQESLYAYDTATGRVSAITGHRPSHSIRQFDYTYRPGSNLVASVIGHDFGFRRDLYHESWRNLIDDSYTSWGGTTKAHFHYDYDWIEQCNAHDESGDLPVALGYSSTGTRDEFTYTKRGEVDSAAAHRLDNSADMPDRYRDWAYDNQGSRAYQPAHDGLPENPGEINAGGSTSYTPGARNEYTAIAGIGRAYDADGNLTNDGTWNYWWDGENRLSVMQRISDGQRLEYTYDYQGRRVRKTVFGLHAEYFNSLDLSGSPALVRTDRSVDFHWGGASPGAGVNASNISARWTGSVIPSATGTWQFHTGSDDGVRLWINGTLVIDNWSYHGWTIDSSAGISLQAGQPCTVKMEWFQGGGGSDASLMWSGPGVGMSVIPMDNLRASDSKYIYDGWNIIAELNAVSNNPYDLPLLRTFTWGLDVTGTIHGAGGVGGLLAIHDATSATSGCHLPIYDTNGNVRGLLNGYDGRIMAAYGYSAYGETLQVANPQGGSYAEDNPIRFASKWLDSETGLYDYNHRVYSPSEGRFISRDPIAENGGLNLYAYCGNDPVGSYDYLGEIFAPTGNPTTDVPGAISTGNPYIIAAVIIFDLVSLFGHRHHKYVSPYSKLDNPNRDPTPILVSSTVTRVALGFDATPGLTGGIAIDPIADPLERKITFADRQRLRAIARAIIAALANDPANADVIEALKKDHATIRISTGIQRTRTNRTTGAVTVEIHFGGAASYGTRSHRVSITLDAGGNVSPYVKSHIVHEAIHARDRQAGMDVGGKDNLDSEVNAWERTLLQQMKDVGKTEEPSHMKLINPDGTVDRAKLRRELSKQPAYKQTTVRNPTTGVTTTIPESRAVDEPFEPSAEFTIDELLRP